MKNSTTVFFDFLKRRHNPEKSDAANFSQCLTDMDLHDLFGWAEA